MPVTTRRQSQSKEAPSPPCSLSKVPNPRRRQASIPSRDPHEDEEYPLTPRSLNAATPPAVKRSTAAKAPLSHPIALQASPSSDSMDGAAFKIAAVPADPPTPTAAAAAAAPSLDEEPAAAAAAAQPSQAQAHAAAAPEPPRRLRPEEKLLKRLPDQAVECTKLPDGPEPVAVEVAYPSREELQAVEGDAAAALADALAKSASPEWTQALEGLALLRRLAVHHGEVVLEALPTVVPLALKSLRSLRSTVCKTAIMTFSDLYLSFGDAMLAHTDAGGAAKPTDSVLAQMLLKAASNDKRFVVEEAQRVLQTMAAALPPAQLLGMLGPYTEHKNPKVRGKAAGVAAAAAERLSPADAAAYGLPALLKPAARLVTDNTPDAREGAKRLAAVVKAALADARVREEAFWNIQVPPAAAPLAANESLAEWECFCQSTLGASGAAAVLRAVE